MGSAGTSASVAETFIAGEDIADAGADVGGIIQAGYNNSFPAVHDGWMWDLTVPGNNDHDFYVAVAATSVSSTTATLAMPIFTSSQESRLGRASSLIR
jgi:hypothetical protein